MITESSIRERLAQDKAKVSRLASWEEVEFLLDLIDELRDDEDESDQLRNRMAGLLRDVAAGLKGEPGPLESHDWSDLPELARATQIRIGKLETAFLLAGRSRNFNREKRLTAEARVAAVQEWRDHIPHVGDCRVPDEPCSCRTIEMRVGVSEALGEEVEAELLRRWGKTADELAAEAEAGYDISKMKRIR
jgi:hypothetical protein